MLRRCMRGRAAACSTSVLSPLSFSTALMICNIGVMPVPPAIMPTRVHFRSSSPPPCGAQQSERLGMAEGRRKHLRGQPSDGKHAPLLVREAALGSLERELQRQSGARERRVRERGVPCRPASGTPYAATSRRPRGTWGSRRGSRP